MQDSIPIARELQYIRDYIALQRLRIRASDNITVETEIVDPLDDRRITPMLLIPFVENAFKHGISLVEKSWIRISLRFDEDALYFDAYNSIHRAGAGDPEHARSGLGLENVKRRLEMLYPQRHELVIRETAKEFFVHLTLRS
jgi:LytS/YehU family sensor histidine kinase